MKLDFRPNSTRTAHRREPLYTLTEVAERLKTSTNRIVAVARHHPGLQCEKVIGASTVAPRRRLYRMSAVRAWWSAAPTHMKGV